jgi:hypothetical protein
LRPDTDAAQFAFELNSIALAVQHDAALTDLDAAFARGRRMFEHLLAYYLPRNT